MERAWRKQRNIWNNHNLSAGNKCGQFPFLPFKEAICWQLHNNYFSEKKRTDSKQSRIASVHGTKIKGQRGCHLFFTSLCRFAGRPTPKRSVAISGTRPNDGNWQKYSLISSGRSWTRKINHLRRKKKISKIFRTRRATIDSVVVLFLQLVVLFIVWCGRLVIFSAMGPSGGRNNMAVSLAFTSWKVQCNGCRCCDGSSPEWPARRRLGWENWRRPRPKDDRHCSGESECNPESTGGQTNKQISILRSSREDSLPSV